jgi:hypothetical protein
MDIVHRFILIQKEYSIAKFTLYRHFIGCDHDIVGLRYYTDYFLVRRHYFYSSTLTIVCIGRKSRSGALGNGMKS